MAAAADEPGESGLMDITLADLDALRKKWGRWFKDTFTSSSSKKEHIKNLQETFIKFTDDFWFHAIRVPEPKPWIKDCFALVHQYSKANFNDENTIFLYQINYLLFAASKPKSPEDKIKYLDFIYDTLIDDEAGKTINVSSRMRKAFKALKENRWMDDGKLVYPALFVKNIWLGAQKELKKLIKGNLETAWKYYTGDSAMPHSTGPFKEVPKAVINLIELIEEHQKDINAWKEPTDEQKCQWVEHPEAHHECASFFVSDAHYVQYHDQSLLDDSYESFDSVDDSSPYQHEADRGAYRQYSAAIIDGYHHRIVNPVYDGNDANERLYGDDFTEGLLFGGLSVVVVILIFIIGLVCGMVVWRGYMAMQSQRKHTEKDEDRARRAVHWENDGQV